MSKVYEAKSREEMLIKNLQYQIRHKEFNSKEELNNYLIELKNKGLSHLNSEQEKSLLVMFEQLQNMDNKHSTLNEKTEFYNFSSLKTIEDNVSTTSVVNEPVHNNEEIPELVALTDIVYIEQVEKELLYKVKFFITNSGMNINAFAVNLNNSLFYNTETNTIYEVRKNPENGKQYEIINKSEKAKLFKHKVKTKKLDNQTTSNIQNAAFTRVGFLVINILTFAMLTTMIILLNK